MKLVSSFILMVLISFTAMAGIRDVGSGGAGILENGQLHLLDLFEVGVTKPMIDKSVVPDADLLEKSKAMPHFSDAESILFAQKLTELRRVSPRFANVLALAIEKYRWYLIETPLSLIREETPLDLSKVEMVQIANRLENRIRIYKPYWLQLSPENRVALIVHELVYSVQRPVPVASSPNIFAVDSIRVRSAVAWMFSEEFHLANEMQVEELTGFQAKPAAIRGSQLLALDQDSVVLEGYIELNLSKSLDREYICAQARQSVAEGQAVRMGRELLVSWSTLFFSTYTAVNGTVQQSLRLSSNAYDPETLPMATWKSATIELPELVFDAENIGRCEQLLEDVHADSVKHFYKID